MNRDGWEAAIGDALERHLRARPEAAAAYDRDADYRLQLTVACDVLTTVAMSAEQTVHIPRDGVRQLLTDTIRRLVADGAAAADERQRMLAIATQQLATMSPQAVIDTDGVQVRSPRPFCRWCQQVIRRDDDQPGWRHAGSDRTQCADLQHHAEPAVEVYSLPPSAASRPSS